MTLLLICYEVWHFILFCLCWGFTAQSTQWGHVERGQFTYCPFDISWKDVFCLAFYFKWKYFVLIDHILSETICLLCFCVLFSNIYTKIKVTAKNLSDLCNFYSKVIFWDFCPRKYFFTFLCWIRIIDVLQQYCENFRKIEQVELVENLAPSYLPYRFLHDLAMGKSGNIGFF